MTKPLDPRHVNVQVQRQSYYVDTIARTACYGGDLCKFEEAWWYAGSEATFTPQQAREHAQALTLRCLRAADRKLVRQ